MFNVEVVNDVRTSFKFEQFWMDKAEKEGFYEVAQKFKERIESNVAFPGRSHLNAILKNVHQNDSINGSLLMNDSINSSNRSTGRQSLPSSDTIQNTSHDSPSVSIII